MPSLTAYQKAPQFVRDLWQTLLDKDDRSSPAEYPEMCLITFEEFERYLADAGEQHSDAIFAAYLGVGVLEIMCKKAGLALAATRAKEIALELDKAFPGLATRSALR